MHAHLVTCKLCGSVHTSFPSLWSHYRTLHETVGDTTHTNTQNASLYDAQDNVSVDRLCEASAEGTEIVDRPLHPDRHNPSHLHQPDVSHEVLRFYERLSQHSTLLISEYCSPSPPTDELPPPVILVINFCLSQNITVRTQRVLYHLITDYDNAANLDPTQTFSKCFPSKTSFVEYIHKLRHFYFCDINCDMRLLIVKSNQ